MSQALDEAQNAYLNAAGKFRDVCEEEVIAEVQRRFPDADWVRVTAVVEEGYTEHEIDVFEGGDSMLSQRVAQLSEYLPDGPSPHLNEDWFLTVTEGVCVFETVRTIPIPEVGR